MKTLFKTIFILILLSSCGKNNKTEPKIEKDETENRMYEYSNDIGKINHFADHIKETNYQIGKEMGKKVWAFSSNHPDASILYLNITDRCVDRKGNTTNTETVVSIKQNYIKEFSTYNNASLFNENCNEYWGILALYWRPCGKFLDGS